MAPTAQLDRALAGDVETAGRQARAAVLRAFRGVSARDVEAAWPEIEPLVRLAIVTGQDDALTAVVRYLSALVGSEVAVDAGIWSGRIGDVPLDDWLAITPRAHVARVAGGMSWSEAAATTAGYLVSRAEGESHRVAREAVAVTSSRDPQFLGWARVAEPGACSFCRMLATRGAVYTEQTVTRTFGGLKFHTKRPNGSGGECKCRAVAMPRYTGQSDWDGAGVPRAKVPAQVMTRAQDVAQQLRVLRQQVADGKGTAWTERRIAELEAEQAGA